LTSLGLSAGTTTLATALGGLTLTIGATGGGVPTSITFGNGTAGTVKSLSDLNAALAANNLQASVSTAGVINIVTTNDAASATIGTIGGTAAGAGKPFNGLVAAPAVKDVSSQNIRAGLISQYNNMTAMQGPKNYMSLLVNRARMEGMVVFDYTDRFPVAVKELAGYLKSSL